MIRKDSSINGIVIQKNEFKLSQYTDGTQIFLDGIEISLRKMSPVIIRVHLVYKINLYIQ